MFKEIKLNRSYEDYMKPALIWATESAEDLARALDVIKITSRGSFISGLFGGERRIDAESYAGLIVSDLRPARDGLYIRLYNMDKEYLAPSTLMKKHGIDIYKLYYRGRINPFKCSAYDVILSSISSRELKMFIEGLIRINKKIMTEADERRLRRLAEELKTQINVLRGSHYVMYRSNAAFTACVPEDLSKAVASINTSSIECKSAEQAYYYAAVLNYMVYKVISKKRTLLRDQHSKSALAIVAAGLSWKELPSQLRDEIARLSHELSVKLTWIEYPTQRKAILETARRPEFKRIIKLLDKHIKSEGKQEMLEGALDFVSSRSRRR